MAALNPPYALQNAGATHTAAGDRMTLAGLIAGALDNNSMTSRGGVCPNAGGEFAVTQTGSPSMQVAVNSGVCYVPGTASSTQGVYGCVNDASVNVTVTTAHGTLPRIDSLVARVYDSQYAGATDLWALEVIAGTANVSPSAPTLPDNCLRLANIAVGAAVTSIINANITDVRPWLAAAGGIVSVRNSTERDALLGNAANAQAAFRLDTGLLEIRHNGVWVPRSPQRPLISNQTLTQPPFNVVGSFVDFLSGVWAPITFTAPPSGTFTVTIGAAIYNNNTATSTIWAAYRVSGGLVSAADESTGLSTHGSGSRLYASRSFTWTGATAGASVTVTPQWNISSGNAGTCQLFRGQLTVRLES